MLPFILATSATGAALCTCRSDSQWTTELTQAITAALENDPTDTLAAANLAYQCTNPNSPNYEKCGTFANTASADFCGTGNTVQCEAIAMYNTFSNNFTQTMLDADWLFRGDATITVTNNVAQVSTTGIGITEACHGATGTLRVCTLETNDDDFEGTATCLEPAPGTDFTDTDTNGDAILCPLFTFEYDQDQETVRKLSYASADTGCTITYTRENGQTTSDIIVTGSKVVVPLACAPTGVNYDCHYADAKCYQANAANLIVLYLDDPSLECPAGYTACPAPSDTDDDAGASNQPATTTATTTITTINEHSDLLNAAPVWTWTTSYANGNPSSYKSSKADAASPCDSSTPQTPWCDDTECYHSETTGTTFCSTYGGYYYAPANPFSLQTDTLTVDFKATESFSGLQFSFADEATRCLFATHDYSDCQIIEGTTICITRELQDCTSTDDSNADFRLFQLLPVIRRAEHLFCDLPATGTPDRASTCYSGLSVDSELYDFFTDQNIAPNDAGHWSTSDDQDNNCIQVSVIDPSVYFCSNGPHPRLAWATMTYAPAEAADEATIANTKKSFDNSLAALEGETKKFDPTEVNNGNRWIDRVLRQIPPGDSKTIKITAASAVATRRSRRSTSPDEESCDDGTTVGDTQDEALPDLRTPLVEVTAWLCDCEAFENAPCYTMAAVAEDGGGGGGGGGGSDSGGGSGGDSLSDGAIAGIVVGSIAGVGLVGFSVFKFYPSAFSGLTSSTTIAADPTESVPLRLATGGRMFV